MQFGCMDLSKSLFVIWNSTNIFFEIQFISPWYFQRANNDSYFYFYIVVYASFMIMVNIPNQYISIRT